MNTKVNLCTLQVHGEKSYEKEKNTNQMWSQYKFIDSVQAVK